jgi:hypothetical protein
MKAGRRAQGARGKDEQQRMESGLMDKTKSKGVNYDMKRIE